MKMEVEGEGGRQREGSDETNLIHRNSINKKNLIKEAKI